MFGEKNAVGGSSLSLKKEQTGSETVSLKVLLNAELAEELYGLLQLLEVFILTPSGRVPKQ